MAMRAGDLEFDQLFRLHSLVTGKAYGPVYQNLGSHSIYPDRLIVAKRHDSVFDQISLENTTCVVVVLSNEVGDEQGGL